jgi:hypothetical protein
MKKQYKAILLAVLGLGGISAAQAQDALLGFNDAGGTANDYVTDLGALSQFTTTTTINLSSDFSAASFTAAFGATPDSNVAAGFVGSTSGILLESYAGGTPAGALPSGTPTITGYNQSSTDASSVLTGVYASSTSAVNGIDGWSYIISQSTTSGGAQGGNALAQNTGNPEGLLSSGAITLAVYEATATTGRHAATTPFTEIGTLAVNTATDSVIYNGVAVPEPNTYGVLAGAGLLIVSLRNKFSGKNA